MGAFLPSKAWLLFFIVSWSKILLNTCTAVSRSNCSLSFVERKQLLGINPQINVSSNVKIIKSPLLAWSRNNAYLTFRYIMTKPFTATARKVITCYRDLGGKYLQRRWFTTITIKPREEGKVCVRVVDPYRYRYLCSTFRVELVVGSTRSGILGIDRVDFGGYEVCKNYPIKRKTLKCDFEEDSCGIRTDFCSLHDWTIQERGSGFSRGYGQQTSIKRSTGLPLLKRNVTGNNCSYAVCIPCFQRSGFEVTVIKSRTPPRAQMLPRDVIELGERSLLIDSSDTTALFAILDLPEVSYDPANRYLKFYYEMVPEGIHNLIVRARCTAKVSNDIIPLAPFGVEYKIPNQHIEDNTSGFICVHIHQYVKEESCPEFTIQLHAVAVGTPLVVDSVSFSDQLQPECGKDSGFFMICSLKCFICSTDTADNL